MKKLILFICFFSFAIGNTFAQSNLAEVKNDTDKLTSIYSLSADQQIAMEKVMVTKHRNLTEIKELQTKNPALFDQKLKTIAYGTEMSMRRILNQDQLRIFRDQLNLQKKQKADAVSNMKKAGATDEEIKKAIQAIILEN